MSKYAVAVLHGPGQEGSPLGESADTHARIHKALEVQRNTGVDLIASGGFTDDAAQYLFHGMDQSDGAMFFREPDSRDTITNGLNVFTDVVSARGYNHLYLVTADYHMSRSARIFRRVMGGIAEIEPVEAPTDYSGADRLKLQAKELVLTGISLAILTGFDPNDEASVERSKTRARKAFPSRYSPVTGS